MNRLAAGLTLTALLSAGALQSAQAIEWTHDLTTVVGMNPSLCSRGSSTYMAFFGIDSILHLGARGDCTWSLQDLDECATCGVSARCAVANGPGGEAGIAYLKRLTNGNYEVWYARTAWGSIYGRRRVDAADLGAVSLAIDANSVAHIAYYASGALMYATVSWTLTVTTPVVVTSGSQAGWESNSIAIASDGNARIAYTTFNGTWCSLYLARYTGSTWTTAAVNTTEGCMGCALALDSSDQAHIAYQATNRQSGTTHLAYASWSDQSQSWTTATVGSSEVKEWTALTLTAGGLARIAGWSWLRSANAAIPTYFYEDSTQGVWASSAFGDTVDHSQPGPLGIGLNSADYGVIGYAHGLASCAEGAAGEPDVTPPATVTDLSVETGPHTARIMWTASGDDGSEGTARNNDVRYSRSAITDYGSFEAATPVEASCPSEAGTQECASARGLTRSTPYYFALKVRDNAGNWSGMSNVVYTGTKYSGTESLCTGGGEWSAEPAYGLVAEPSLTIASENPTAGPVQVRYAVPATAIGAVWQLAVYDLLGRKVRDLRTGGATPGNQRITWDLRTDEGTRVRAGVFFVRMRLGAFGAERTVIVRD